jgi:hypothetical protein
MRLQSLIWNASVLDAASSFALRHPKARTSICSRVDIARREAASHG